MKPQRNRARDIGFYVLILVLLACTLFTLLNQEPENELSYAQVKDFFNDVDTVSGATLSSTAVRNGVNAVVRYYNEEIAKGGKA